MRPTFQWIMDGTGMPAPGARFVFDTPPRASYSRHVKRPSRTLEHTLEDLVRRLKAQRIFELAGSGLWQGSLPEMRRDTPKRRPRPTRRQASLR